MAAPKPGVWGIDLGQCALKAIKLEMIDGQVAATAFDYIEHPKILSQPDADPDQLTHEALEQFLSRNKVQWDMVVISVPGQSGLARFVKLPPVEEKKIADIVRFEAKQQIPFPLEEVVWDFQKIGAGIVTDGFAMETEIGLFAMKRDMVSRYLQHFKDVNVEVHIVQMSPLALCNFVSYDLLGKDSNNVSQVEEEAGKKPCVVALDIGTDNSNLVITDGEKIIWQRPIPLGGNHFTRALTKDLKLTFAKAEHLKRNAVKSPDLKKILSSLKTVLNDFVGEVQRSLGYFTNTHRDAQIQFIVGLGNAFRLPGLQKFLQEKLQLEVRKLQTLERLGGDKVTAEPQFNENILSFGVAYGLALQGLKLPRLQTNLLPYEIQVERMVRGKKPWAVAAAAVLLLAVAGLTFGRNQEYQAVDPKSPEIKSAIDAADRLKNELKDYDNKWNDANSRYVASGKAIIGIGAGIDERLNWNLLYQYVNMALPRPDGAKLSLKTRLNDDARKKYLTAQAREAHKLVLQKRFTKASKEQPDPKETAKADEFIKKNLVQINIEGIDSLYFDNLTDYFRALKEDKLIGMDPVEKDQVLAMDAKLPKKGWVFEIRGHTHHWDAEIFVENTLLENLRNPKGVDNVIPKDMQDKVQMRMNYLWVKGAKINNPESGRFKFIKSSFVAQLVKSGGGKDKGQNMNPDMKGPPQGPDAKGPPGQGGKGGERRGNWQPIGEVAGSLFSGGKGDGASSPFASSSEPVKKAQAGEVPLQPRTEFVILFVWQEPTIEERQAAKTTIPN